MRTVPLARLFLLLPLVAVLGCSSNNRGKIEGTNWRSDHNTYKGMAVPDGFLKLNFHTDGTMIYRAGANTFSGKYYLGPGNAVTFELDQSLGGRKTHIESIAISDDRMKVVDGDGTEATFRKVK
jgi:hypothetical protein